MRVALEPRLFGRLESRRSSSVDPRPGPVETLGWKVRHCRLVDARGLRLCVLRRLHMFSRRRARLVGCHVRVVRRFSGSFRVRREEGAGPGLQHARALRSELLHAERDRLAVSAGSG